MDASGTNGFTNEGYTWIKIDLFTVHGYAWVYKHWQTYSKSL